MKALEIPRMKLGSTDVAIEYSRIEVDKKAKEMLGYKVPSQQIAEPKALAFTLRKLGIEPFRKEHVLSYMGSKEKKGMWSGDKNALLSIFSLAVSISATVTGLVAHHRS